MFSVCLKIRYHKFQWHCGITKNQVSDMPPCLLVSSLWTLAFHSAPRICRSGFQRYLDMRCVLCGSAALTMGPPEVSQLLKELLSDPLLGVPNGSSENVLPERSALALSAHFPHHHGD